MTFLDITTPTWKQIGDMQREIDILHAENALKLTQILDLETTLYHTRILNLDDGSPCWCCLVSMGIEQHDEGCDAARKATEPFWKT